MRKLILTSLLASCCFFIKAQAPNDYDSTFNSIGYYINTLDTGVINTKAIALQSDQKIITAGTFSSSPSNTFFIDRYLTSGIPDVSFGTGGRITLNLPGTSALNDMLVQPDDFILILGDYQVGPTKDMILARFKPDGNLDSTFGINGWIVYDMTGGDNETMNSFALQSTGKIVATGYCYNTAISNYDFGFARLNTDGSLDTTFNHTGIKFVDAGMHNYSYNVGIQSDDRIILVGFTAYGLDGTIVVRLTASGQVDTTFSSGGIDAPPCIICTGDYAKTIAILPDDSYIVSADGMDWGGDIYMTTRRYHANGSIDLSFNGTSSNQTSFSPDYPGNTATLALSDGKVMAGAITYVTYVSTPYNKYASMIRYNLDGTKDTTFGNGNLVNYEILNAPQTLRDMALQMDGHVLFCGETYDSTMMTSYSYVARIVGGNVSTPNSVATIKNKTADFVILPNPTAGIFSILSDKEIQAISITNSLGVCVKSIQGDLQNVQIDISTFENGIYIVTAKTKSGNSIKKLVKQ